MRIAAAAVLVLLTTACSGTPSTSTSSSTPAAPPSLPMSSSAATTKVLTWGESGTSTDVDIQIDTPTVSTKPVIGTNGKPDPAFKFVLLPITATNKSSGTATISVFARVGQQQADVYDAENGVGKFLPGEGGKFERPIKVAANATGDLVLEVYANIDHGLTKNRLNFKGPLP